MSKARHDQIYNSVYHEICPLIESTLSKGRYRHTLSVKEQAISIYKDIIDSNPSINLSKSAVKLAAVSHDMCREWSRMKLIQYKIRKEISKIYNQQEALDNYPAILHGLIAGDILYKMLIQSWKKHYQTSPTKDEVSQIYIEVIYPICTHTLGRTSMSIYEQILYVADATEQYRPPEYRDDVLRLYNKQKPIESLPQMIKHIAKLSIEWLKRQRQQIHPAVYELLK